MHLSHARPPSHHSTSLHGALGKECWRSSEEEVGMAWRGHAIHPHLDALGVGPRGWVLVEKVRKDANGSQNQIEQVATKADMTTAEESARDQRIVQ